VGADLGAQVSTIAERLSLRTFEPTSGRLKPDDRSFTALAVEIDRLAVEVESAVAGDSAAMTDAHVELRAGVAHVLGKAAAVAIAAGATARAQAWLEQARELVPFPADRAVFEEALRAPALFRLLMEAEWRLVQGDEAGAKRIARTAQRQAQGSRALALVAEQMGGVETPPRRVPDTRAKVRGSSIAALAVIVVVVLAAGAFWYFTSARYKLKRSLDAAAEQEAQARTAQQREAAIATYEALLEKSGDAKPEALTRAALGIARLNDASLPAPLLPKDVDAAMKALQRFAAIPAATRAGEPTDFVCGRAQSQATRLEQQGVDGLYGARRLLGKALRLCGDTVAPSLKRVRLELARLDAKEWPLLALADYAQDLDADEAITESAKLIDAIADDDVSIWREVEPSLARWLKATRGLPEQEARAVRVQDRSAQAAAYFASAERKALEHDATIEALTRAVAAQPRDQELWLALAGHDADPVALATLSKLGAPGKMTRATALLYAELLQRAGKLAEAEAILDKLVQQQLPAYEDARADYSEAMRAFYDKWYETAREGDLPVDIETELKSASQEEAPALFDKWVSKRAEADDTVKQRLARMEQSSQVVPTVLSLGTVKLLRAAQQTGAQQQQTLAAAERLFLSIRSDAAGAPAYHLGLAQVYYRLGKLSEGEREFGELLNKAEPPLELSVARAYRGVGAITRARAVTTAVYEKAGSPHREQAALLMALMADTLDDQRTWLLRSDQNELLVKMNLLELEANRACLDGQIQEGDRKYREVAQQHLEGSGLDESNFNNAALAQAARVACTGQSAPLDEALRLMQRALRLAPASSLLADNAAPLLVHRGLLRVLSRWLDPTVLYLDSGDAAALVDALEEGPHRDEVKAALKDDPDVKQARELSRNVRVLAPSQPGPYAFEAEWLERFEDGPGLNALLSAVRTQKLDTGPLLVARQRWLSGELDNTRRDRLHKEEAKLKRLIAALPASQAAALAALRYLEAERATDLIGLDEPLARAEQAVRALEAADRAWPALAAKRRLQYALLVTAAVRAGSTLPALASRLRSEAREYGWSLSLARIAEEGEAGITAIITAQPDFASALALARAASELHAINSDWSILRLAGDSAGADRVAAQLFNERRTVSTELGRLLQPGNAAEASAAFTRAHTAKAAPP
jgi:hypothetical protein